MSDFDPNMFTEGRTEFGLWTKYGDYVEYAFENQVGSGVEPAVINYTDANQNDTSISIFREPLVEFNKSSNFGNPVNSNAGTNSSDAISYPQTYVNEDGDGLGISGTEYVRYNIKA